MSANAVAQLGKLATVTASGAVTLGKHSSWNATSGALTATLPPLTSGAVQTALAAGQIVRARISKSKSDASLNAITVACSGSDTFEGGSATQTLLAAGEKLTVAAQTVPGSSGPVWVIEEHTTPRDTLDLRFPSSFTATGYDIVLIMGQSNASGRANVDNNGFDVPNPRVDQYGAAGSYANLIAAAFDPLAHPDRVSLGNGLGPGTGFARWYTSSMSPGRRLLLVPAAYGGTPLVSTAALGWRRGVAGNLYARALSQVLAAKAIAGAGAQIVAALWVQGEADGDANITGPAYQTDFDALITGLRADLSLPNLPFIIGGMVPEYLTSGTRAAIDTVQQGAVTRLANVGYAPGPHTQNQGDGNHYNSVGARLLGRGMFVALRRVLNPAVFPAAVQDDGNPAGSTISNTATPVITGTTTVGQVLTVSNGTWTPTPDTYGYQWNRSGSPISNAISSTYTLVSADAGATIDCTVTAIKSGWISGVKKTAATAAIGSGAAATTYMADNFTRADNASSMGSTSTGAFPWTALSGTWGISGNQAYEPGAVGGANHIVVADDGQSDGTISVTIGAVGGDPSKGVIAFRATDDSNYFMVSGTGSLYRKVTGSFQQLAALSGTGPAVGDIITVVLNGSSIVVKQNGTQIGSITHTFNQTATKHGFRVYGDPAYKFSAISHTSATS